MGAAPGKQTLNVDTGLLRFAIDTFIGHSLSIDSLLQVQSGGNTSGPGWRALADFGSTFHSELSANAAGVDFGNLSPGIYNPAPIPEPGSAVLMLAGLLGVLKIARPRRIASLSGTAWPGGPTTLRPSAA